MSVNENDFVCSLFNGAAVAQINFVGSVRGKDDVVFQKLKLKFVGLTTELHKVPANKGI